MNIIATDIQEISVKNFNYTIDRKISKALVRGDTVITVSYNDQDDAQEENDSISESAPKKAKMTAA